MHNKLTYLWFLVGAVALGVSGGGCGQGHSASSEPVAGRSAKYHCPMHPLVVSDRPADCPSCGMKLVLIKQAEPASAKKSATQPAEKYHCPMHPQYVADHKADCPVCGMKYVLIKKVEPVSAPAHAAEKYHCPMHPQYVADHKADCPVCGMKYVLIKPVKSASALAASTKTAPGRVAVRLSPEKQQLIGLRTALVEPRELTDATYATATVQPDETRRQTIVARFRGWVLSLRVNYTGQAVTNGQPLMTVYSPELLSFENEYRLAYQTLENARKGGNKDLVDSAVLRLAAVRRKLELYNVGVEEIRALEQGGKPSDELLLRSPFTGFVSSKQAYVGYTFEAGAALYEVVDLSHVWLRTFIFEYELARVAMGQKARITFPHLGHKTFESAVTFISPRIDPLTRRAEVRLELDNPDQELRLDMWANVEIQMPAGKVLTVPASAVMDTGSRFVAFVLRDGGTLEPRELEIGMKTDDYYEVRHGVEEGERVVTRALFLIDSESQLRAAIAAMSTEGGYGE